MQCKDSEQCGAIQRIRSQICRKITENVPARRQPVYCMTLGYLGIGSIRRLAVEKELWVVKLGKKDSAENFVAKSVVCSANMICKQTVNITSSSVSKAQDAGVCCELPHTCLAHLKPV